MDRISLAVNWDYAEKARRWVDETCRAQGVEPKISDPATVLKVAAVLIEASDAPDRIQAVGVKSVAPTRRAADDHMIENRRNDGALLMEVELGPAAP